MATADGDVHCMGTPQCRGAPAAPPGASVNGVNAPTA